MSARNFVPSTVIDAATRWHPKMGYLAFRSLVRSLTPSLSLSVLYMLFVFHAPSSRSCIADARTLKPEAVDWRGIRLARRSQRVMKHRAAQLLNVMQTRFPPSLSLSHTPPLSPSFSFPSRSRPLRTFASGERKILVELSSFYCPIPLALGVGLGRGSREGSE